MTVRRLRSSSGAPHPDVPPRIDVVTETGAPTRSLREQLCARQGLVLVAATADQAHRLATLNDGPAVSPWFDLILIDEASQMDVAHGVVALSCLADGGAVVVAGDPKQLPPIHQAEAPAGLEAMVGSIYTYLADVHGVPAVMLEDDAPLDAVRGAVDTVERFQGQQRDVIVASFALGDPDTVGDEEEFLLGLERFNVMVSRARAKCIVLLSETVVRHLAEDVEVLRASQLLKGYVEGWCDASEPLALAMREAGASVPIEGTLRWHRAVR